jgi:hypothetical protein
MQKLLKFENILENFCCQDADLRGRFRIKQTKGAAIENITKLTDNTVQME